MSWRLFKFCRTVSLSESNEVATTNLYTESVQTDEDAGQARWVEPLGLSRLETRGSGPRLVDVRFSATRHEIE
jgi:hypothetical protein